jgi:hypothetical protein
MVARAETVMALTLRFSRRITSNLPGRSVSVFSTQSFAPVAAGGLQSAESCSGAPLPTVKDYITNQKRPD